MRLHTDVMLIFPHSFGFIMYVIISNIYTNTASLYIVYLFVRHAKYHMCKRSISCTVITTIFPSEYFNII